MTHMKKYWRKTIQLLAIASLPLFLTQCKDEEEIRWEIDDAIEGVNFRVQPDNSQFDASDPSAQVQLSYYTENTNIARVDVLAEYYSLLNDETSPRYLLEQVTSGFSNDGSHKNVITLEELKGAVGVTDLAGGDRFTLYHVVHLADGRQYPDTLLIGETEYVNVENGIMVASASRFTAV